MKSSLVPKKNIFSPGAMNFTEKGKKGELKVS